MSMKKVNDQVFYATDKIVKIDSEDIETLKKMVTDDTSKRIRLCTHTDTEDRLHEMFILLGKDTYIRPHRHPNKSESFHIVEGTVEVVIFDDSGKIKDVIQMGDYFSGNKFYYRIKDPYYHVPHVTSDFVILHETTDGPFDRGDTDFASWAPEENNHEEAIAFMKKLSKDVNNFLNSDE